MSPQRRKSDKSPFTRFDEPHACTSGELALTRTEYDLLISKVDNYEDELLIKLAVSTGIRREDITHLKIADIDLEHGTLAYHESKKKRNRVIQLQDPVVLLIKRFLGEISEKRETLFSFSGRTAYRHFNYWCREAGIPERPFHALRATCIKFCQRAGWSPEQVQRLTGDSWRVIQAHYSTPSISEMDEVTKCKPTI